VTGGKRSFPPGSFPRKAPRKVGRPRCGCGPQQQQLFNAAARCEVHRPFSSHWRGVSMPRITEMPGNCSTKASRALHPGSNPLRGEKIQALSLPRGQTARVARHQYVAGLIDQPHGVKLAGMNQPVRMLFNVREPCDAIATRGRRPHWQKPRFLCRKTATPRTVPFTRLPGYMNSIIGNRTPNTLLGGPGLDYETWKAQPSTGLCLKTFRAHPSRFFAKGWETTKLNAGPHPRRALFFAARVRKQTQKLKVHQRAVY